MRISKNPEERKSELMDAAEKLFATVGYNKTSVSDIVKKISVAQGTFYYYFKSKEDIFIAIFARKSDIIFSKIKRELENEQSNAMDKLIKAVKIYIKGKSKKSDIDDKLIEALHLEENAGLHYRTIIYTIKTHLPLFADIIKQGVNEGLFNTEYPEAVAELLITQINFTLDPGVFRLDMETMLNKSEALINIIEKVLEVPKGSFIISLTGFSDN
ncbi:TetR/AcrR family transcriptional regulator [Clostridium felsineum]|uniref:Uncharacterized protein n=1 Tax=Clostridium felsineum TaxID=36839 RepID=A0A1S8L605_9CLOT|nr:TetR/AcrR family transcriptional regulator [Clostridium felsineum]URZ08658.1 hypothetical protein CLROS_040400 [Clostridium felsineum]URZ13688.1 hypothetical protein CROST_044540 [Clostridium felsineum]